MSKIKALFSGQQVSSDDDTLCSSLLEELAMSDDPPLTFPQAFLPSVELLLFLLRRSINLSKFGVLYLLLLGIAFKLIPPYYGSLHQVCFASLIVLPAIFMAMAVLFIAHVFIAKRQPAFESAHNLLRERIQQDRAIRKEGSYDVYLPSSSSKEDAVTKHGIIFFPGALISHTAYASLAAKLSDQHGIVVVVMSYGLTRLSMDVSACQQMAQLAMLELKFELATIGIPPVDQWTLAGHSLGGTLALNAAASMESIEKVVLCGVGRDALGVPSTLRSSKKDVLVLNGSNDPFVTDCTEEQKQDFRACLPPSRQQVSKEDEDNGDDDSLVEKNINGMTTYVTIEGGNHTGFAHYGPQTYPKRDGKRTISIDEQQEIFVQKTLELLNLLEN